MRHPFGFRWGNDYYVYYLSDAGVAPNGARDSSEEGGIFVARAQIINGMIGRFYCGSDFSKACLPANYSNASRTKWEDSLAMAGPNVLPILNSQQYPGITSFSVAVVENSNPQRFVGIAELYNGTSGEVKLFSSNDLVRWTYHSLAFTWKGAWTAQNNLHYPQAIRSVDGESGKVDAAHFYIVGGNGADCANWHCKINRITVKNF